MSARGVAAATLSIVVACGAPTTQVATPQSTSGASPTALEVHATSGRPRLAIVTREGDPRAAIAVQLRAGDGASGAWDAAIVADLVADRLRRAGLADVRATAGAAAIARVTATVSGDLEAAAQALDGALSAPIGADDGDAIRASSEAFSRRAIGDAARARADRCLDAQTRSRSFALPTADATVAHAEAARRALATTRRARVAIVGPRASVDGFKARWASLAALPEGTDAPIATPIARADEATIGDDDALHAEIVLEALPRAAIPEALDRLVSPTHAIALRLHAADEWQLEAIDGTAFGALDGGGCIVARMRPTWASSSVDGERGVARAATAIEIARDEIERAVTIDGATDDAAAQTAIATAVDASTAADRAAWWAWSTAPSPTTMHAQTSTLLLRRSAIGLPGKGAREPDELAIEAKSRLTTAIDRARVAAARSELEMEHAIESGQGELWAVLGSPCGTAHESIVDAGLGALLMEALARASASGKVSLDDVTIEPLRSTRGLALVGHAPTRHGESAASLGERVGSALGRAFLGARIDGDGLGRVRAEALASLAHSTSSALLVRAVLAELEPRHPSWMLPSGTDDAVGRVGIDAAESRLEALRRGPIRLAWIGNASDDDAQSHALAAAVDRWVPRRPGESRACPVVEASSVGAGLAPFSVTHDEGVAFAFPIAIADRAAAQALAALLDADAGPLRRAIGAGGFVDAKLVTGVSEDAIVIVLRAADDKLDALATTIRATLAKLRAGAIDDAMIATAEAGRTGARLAQRATARGRALDLFRGEKAPIAIELSTLKALAARTLDEAKLRVVSARRDTR